MRRASIERNTAETQIQAELNLDGSGRYEIHTDCGFLKHMLELFTRHGRFDLTLTCHGDSEVDFHHTVEDIGIVLGQAFRQALGDKKGIVRYGTVTLPMDEALVMVALDLSGRDMAVYHVRDLQPRIGTFDTELAEEFFLAFAREGRMNLHIQEWYGRNTHHILEAAFKGLGRALAQAVAIDAQYADEIPSTKGVL